MKIEDLKENYPLIYEAAYNYRKSQSSYGNIHGVTLNESFNWEETREGRDFWRNISIADFESANLIYPHLFITPSKYISEGIRLEQNGLWKEKI